MKILIIGASGLVGEQVYLASKAAGFDTYGTCRKQNRNEMYRLDITNKSDVRKLIESVNPDVTVLAAALTNVDYCETHNEEAWLTNVDGVKNVAEAAKNSKLVFISTDYIFDGKRGPYSEEDIPNPINYYGLTKLIGENIMLSYENHIIARSTWVYDFTNDTKNFVYRLVNTLKEGKEINVPTDQVANPTLARNLADGIIHLLKKDFHGIINIAGSTRLSRYDFAKAVAEYFLLDTKLVRGANSDELNQTASRPKKAGFKLKRIESELGLKMESLEETLGKLRKQNMIK